MTKQLILNITDPVTEALVKSQNKRIEVLESLIKKKKKKKDIEDEMFEANKEFVKSNDMKFEKLQEQNTSLLEAIKESNNRTPVTVIKSSSNYMPSPS